uniref:energy transducer TonB family protein n=1 Tax=Alistipes sp. TaxID=1872444 RepID=UPI0040564C49
MEQKSDNIQKQTPQQSRSRKPRLRLPFDNRNEDPVGWIYDNRIGLCVTIIVYLVLSIVFVSAKIGTSTRKANETMYIDLSTVELLEDERDRLLEEIKRKNQNIDWRSIRNLSSNENALNENLEDAKGTNASALNASAKAADREMKANREAYERGLREANTIGENRVQGKGNKQRKDVKMAGKVTVSFSLTNPLRYSRYLVKPAYRCEGGGEVVVSIVVNQRGEVTSASVKSGGDECMRQTAVESALNSQFDINNSAPAKQHGTITYVFIPQ